MSERSGIQRREGFCEVTCAPREDRDLFSDAVFIDMFKSCLRNAEHEGSGLCAINF